MQPELPLHGRIIFPKHWFNGLLTWTILLSRRFRRPLEIAEGELRAARAQLLAVKAAFGDLQEHVRAARAVPTPNGQPAAVAAVNGNGHSNGNGHGHANGFLRRNGHSNGHGGGNGVAVGAAERGEAEGEAAGSGLVERAGAKRAHRLSLWESLSGPGDGGER